MRARARALTLQPPLGVTTLLDVPHGSGSGGGGGGVGCDSRVVYSEGREDAGPRRTRERKGCGGGTIGRPSDGGDGDEEVGSSHVDRNGPTKFYPTIREARRGSGPRPTAATARSARAASLELRLASELRVRERMIKGARRGEEAWCGTTTVYGISATTIALVLEYPVSPEGATQRERGRRDVPRVIRKTRRVCPVEEGAAAQECVDASVQE